jgi:hypothetical protein
MRKVLIGAAVLAASLMATGTGSSAIVGTQGAARKVPAPPSVVQGAFESDTYEEAFDERQNVVLPIAVATDISTPGLYASSASLTPGSIPAGTRVSSEMVHCDRVGRSGSDLFLDGTVTTDSDILGIAILEPSLDATDAILGAPGTTYPTGDFQRRLNLDSQDDFVVFQVDRRTVEIQCDLTTDVDQVRIITAANQPPNCTTATASPNLLWPPNHKLNTITVSGVTDPDGDPVTVTITGVTQDEPVNAIADGNTSPDAVLTNPPSNQVSVRAERSGIGDGRVYHILFTATDPSGGSCTGDVTVGVPHDQGGQPIPIDSAPPSYNSLTP